MVQQLDLPGALNDAQREAVESAGGPVLIVAGPGSGKTRVITYRIAHLIRDLGEVPMTILAVTFTNRAAKEMRDRAEALTGRDRGAANVSTFHSFCARLLRVEGERLGLPRNYSIYDEDDQKAALRTCLDDMELDSRNLDDYQKVISNAKANLWTWDDLKNRDPGNEFINECGKVYEAYDGLLRKNKAADFDDLIMQTVRMFREFPRTLRQYQEIYRHMMVDEFQDTNVAQYELTKLLTGQHHNICAVGDPDQAIYSWRSADVRNVERFLEDHPGAKTVTLGQNYRSTGKIVEASKRLISYNYRPVINKLFTENPAGAEIGRSYHHDEHDEARSIIEEVLRLGREEGYRPGDCAVLYRINACSKGLEETAVNAGLQCRVVGGVPFYRRKEVRDITAYLRLASNPDDDVNLLRIINVPARGLGAKSVSLLSTWASERGISIYEAARRIKEGQNAPSGMTARAAQSVKAFGSICEVIRQYAVNATMQDLITLIIERTDMENHIRKSGEEAEQRWEVLMAFLAAVGNIAPGTGRQALEDLLDHVAMASRAMDEDAEEETLTLINLHQVKGLEFPVVFLIGLEQGVLPHQRSMSSEEQYEEERRLCYVGVTRAMDKLYLSRSVKARGFRSAEHNFRSMPAKPSEFLLEMGDDYE